MEPYIEKTKKKKKTLMKVNVITYSSDSIQKSIFHKMPKKATRYLPDMQALFELNQEDK